MKLEAGVKGEVAKLWFDVATAALGGPDTTPRLASALLKEVAESQSRFSPFSPSSSILIVIIGPHKRADIAPGPCKSIL